ncbi:hypothetical protein L1049_015109 [Liquidambar formosana]|uniref:RING-type domain-containing protein n=1 Tax=Liquidambar formosana TaxID=63359 RepID=A0AAP0X2A4_LIQFO
MAIQAQLYSENHGFPLGGTQDWMDNGYGFNEFCFNLQQKQQQQQQLQHMQQLQNQQQHRNQNLFFDNSLLVSALKNNNSSSDDRLPMGFSQSMAFENEKQRQEIDRFISLQNERLRLLLQEQRKQELAVLLKKIESKTVFLLKQKDEEIARAAKRTMELEIFLGKLEMENQSWQRLAEENEATAVSLNTKLEQLRENAFDGFSNGAEDAESCCDESGEDETGENRGGGGCNGEEGEEERTRKMVCKSCNSRNSCVLFLPCRHLCSCKACDAFLDFCPVCRMVKKASIEAMFF